MAVDPACQPIANAIAALEVNRDAIRAGLPGSPPLNLWQALAAIGDLERQIADQQIQLDACQRQHAAAYEAQVVIFDTTGAPPASRKASLWRIDAGDATLLEESALSGAG